MLEGAYQGQLECWFWLEKVPVTLWVVSPPPIPNHHPLSHRPLAVDWGADHIVQCKGPPQEIGCLHDLSPVRRCS